MTARIERVLAAKDPSLTDVNCWEEFALTEVKVRVPDKARYTNLLFACPEHPVDVIGLLEPVDEDQEDLVLDPNYRSKRVIIKNVTLYCYGLYEDGDVKLWAAGEPGWFSIVPCRNYRPFFAEMAEAVNLFFFIGDLHPKRSQRRKQWYPKVDYLFEQYVKHTHGACGDEEGAMEVFERHRAFLIREMLQGKDNVDWAATPVYKYLREKYNELFEDLQKLKWNEGLITNNNNFESLEADEEDRAQADTIFEAILDMKESTRGHLTLKGAAEYLSKRYEMDSLDYAMNLIKACASHLLEMMDNAKSLSSTDWTRKAIYKQLKAAARSPNTQGVRNTPLQPKPCEVVEISSSADEESDEEEHPRNIRRRARMSILRPKLSSVSAKRAGKSAKQISNGDSDSEDGLEDAEDTPTKPGSHRLIRNNLPARQNGSGLSANATMPEPDDPRRGQTETVDLSSDESPVLTSESETDLPPDTWVCSVPGCGKTVYKASSRRSKDVINDHSLVHAEDTETKMNLVFAEQRLNVNANVDYLLSKIRDYGALQGGSASGDVVDPESESKRLKLGE